MAIVKFEAINKAETEMVKKYLAMGLELDINAMSGTQGEKGKVALADDKNVYFIYVDYTSVGDDFRTSHYAMKVIVERHDRDKRDLVDNWHTYWLGKGEIIEEIIYHEIRSDGYDKAYTTDEEEFKQAQEKHFSRYCNHNHGWDAWKKLEKFDMTTVINVVKAKTGRKRVANENIIEVEKRFEENYWRITTMFNGKKSTVIINYAA